MKKPKNQFHEDVDALFRLPLSEFTGARNALVSQLKKSGLGDEASQVKALGKPSVSAWAVNQLYWNHREAFEKLLASGEKFHKAQKSGKLADMRGALDARRDALARLSDLAASVLKETGHNPSPDTLHRVTTTLEGVSAYASRDDGPQLGRLTQDVDPPGFESVGSFVPSRQEAGGRQQEARVVQRAKDDRRQAEEKRKAKLAETKDVLQDAKISLSDARSRLRSLEAAQTRAQAEVKVAEERLRKAKAAVEGASKDVRNAERAVEAAAKELEGL